MPLPRIFAALLPLVIAVPALAAEAEVRPRDPYAAAAGSADTPRAGDAAIPSGDLTTRVAQFLTSFYLSGEDLTREQIAVLYAPRVDYFGDEGRSRAAVIRDKLAYFRRWPDRSYTLVPGTLVVTPVADAPGKVSARFHYDFDVSSGRRQSAGRGVAELELDLGVAGGAISSEGGRVIARR